MIEWMKRIASLASPVSALREQLSLSNAKLSDASALAGQYCQDNQQLKALCSDKDKEIDRLKKTLNECNEKLLEAAKNSGHLEPRWHQD